MAYRDEVLADAPIAYWRLEETSGTVGADETGNHDGAYTGSFDLGQGGIISVGRSARFFSGGMFSFQNPSVSHPLKPSLPLTLEAWVVLSSNPDSSYAVSLDNAQSVYQGAWLRVVAGQAASVNYGDGTGNGPGDRRTKQGTTILQAGVPYHIVGVIRGPTDMSLYINGVDDGGTYSGTGGALAYSASSGSAAGPGLVGSDPDLVIDEIAVYDYALSAARVLAHYDAGVAVGAEPPDTPTISVAAITATSVTLNSSAFSDPNSDTHTASQWQVDLEAGDFSAPVFDSGEDAVNLVSILAGGLLPLVGYKARVRHKDSTGLWSEYSVPVSFSTEEPSGWREFEEDFRTGVEILTKASLDRRPDAVSLDYLTAFAPGPVALGDNSQGLAARVWRVRADGSRVYYSRGAQSSWEQEKILFTYSGPSIVEIDAAFEQNGRFVVAAERHTGLNGAPEIWIYWFDPQLGGGQGDFVFQNFGAGRTPRVVLDNPLDSANSDVQVFYISDSDDAVVHRQQRDRYGNVILTPMTGASNLFLEEVAFTKDKRVLVLASRRNPTTGKYTLEKMYSKLPLQIQAGESMGLGAFSVDAGLKEILKRYSASIEALGLGGSVPFVATESIAVLVGAETEKMGLGGFLASVGLAEVVVFLAAQPEALGLGGRAASAALAVAVIRQDTLEQLDIGASVVAASLTQ